MAVYQVLPIVIVTIILILGLVPTKLTSTPTNRIVTKVIHYNSHESPYFDANYTPRDLEISLARLNFLKLGTQTYFETPVLSQYSIPIFLVGFQIGSQQVPQLVALDTGSGLFWIHCAPGKGGELAFYKNYRPLQSSSYSEKVSCDFCIPPVKCGARNGRCYYLIEYLNNATSNGYISSDTFIFNSSFNIEKQTVIDDIKFGCSVKSTVDDFNGVLGLGPSKMSLVSQLSASEFSYCMGNWGNPSSKGILIIGEKIVGVEKSTPLLIQGFHYYANLEGIRVGGQMLDIDQKLLRRSDYTGGALFDSGSTLTFLQAIAYSKLEEKIDAWMGGSLEKTYYSSFGISRVCYKGDLNRDIVGFPMVTFHFEGGARMDLDKEHIFVQQWPNLVCLSVIDSTQKRFEFSLIGARLQQNFYVSYDLQNMELNFEKVHCEELANSYGL